MEYLCLLCVYEFRIRDEFSLKSDRAEVLFLELSGVSGGRNVIAGIMYLPTDFVMKDFNESLSSSLNLINSEDKLKYSLGEYTINLVKNK